MCVGGGGGRCGVVCYLISLYITNHKYRYAQVLSRCLHDKNVLVNLHWLMLI